VVAELFVIVFYTCYVVQELFILIVMCSVHRQYFPTQLSNIRLS